MFVPIPRLVRVCFSSEYHTITHSDARFNKIFLHIEMLNSKESVGVMPACLLIDVTAGHSESKICLFEKVQ